MLLIEWRRNVSIDNLFNWCWKKNPVWGAKRLCWCQTHPSQLKSISVDPPSLISWAQPSVLASIEKIFNGNNLISHFAIGWMSTKWCSSSPKSEIIFDVSAMLHHVQTALPTGWKGFNFSQESCMASSLSWEEGQIPQNASQTMQADHHFCCMVTVLHGGPWGVGLICGQVFTHHQLTKDLQRKMMPQQIWWGMRHFQQCKISLLNLASLLNLGSHKWKGAWRNQEWQVSSQNMMRGMWSVLPDWSCQKDALLTPWLNQCWCCFAHFLWHCQTDVRDCKFAWDPWLTLLQAKHHQNHLPDSFQEEWEWANFLDHSYRVNCLEQVHSDQWADFGTHSLWCFEKLLSESFFVPLTMKDLCHPQCFEVWSCALHIDDISHQSQTELVHLSVVSQFSPGWVTRSGDFSFSMEPFTHPWVTHKKSVKTTLPLQGKHKLRPEQAAVSTTELLHVLLHEWTQSLFSLSLLCVPACTASVSKWAKSEETERGMLESVLTFTVQVAISLDKKTCRVDLSLVGSVQTYSWLTTLSKKAEHVGLQHWNKKLGWLWELNSASGNQNTVGARGPIIVCFVGWQMTLIKIATSKTMQSNFWMTPTEMQHSWKFGVAWNVANTHCQHTLPTQLLLSRCWTQGQCLLWRQGFASGISCQLTSRGWRRQLSCQTTCCICPSGWCRWNAGF